MKWHDGSDRLRIWQFLCEMSPTWLSNQRIKAHWRDMDLHNISEHTKEMAKAGIVERSGPGKAHAPFLYRVTATCTYPPLMCMANQRAFEVVADCPAGVDDVVIAEELGVTVGMARRLLVRSVELGLAECFERVPGQRTYRPLPVVPEASE